MKIAKTELVKYPETKSKERLQQKCVAFEMLTLLYTRLQVESISDINKAYCLGNSQTGSELTKDIMKFANDAIRKDDTNFNVNLKELCRKYNCAAYNVLTAVICCTQTLEKFYTIFLFQENKAKGSYLWEGLIDSEKEYIFESEIEDNENIKKVSVLRQSLKDDNSENSDGSRGGFTSSLRYLSSKYLSESSLSEDVSQFDFSSSQQAFKKSKRKDKKLIENDSKFKENELTNDKIELELDELNNHECMRNMVALVEVMVNKKLIATETENFNLPLPKFLDNIVKKLDDSEVHKNIKLFLTRFIILNEKAFRPYAGPLSEIFLKLIGRGAYGSELDLFLVDVLLLAIEWSTLAKKEISESTASVIVEFLMKKCAHPSRPIFRRNLDIVKLAIEHWSTKLTISYGIIYDLLKSDRKDFKIVGIQLMGVLLANKLPYYQNTPEVTRDNLLKSVLGNISSDSKDIYAPSCEVAGMILSYMEEKEILIDEVFYNDLVKILTNLGNNPRQKIQFVTSVSYICLHFPPFADSFFSKLLFMLPTAQGYNLSKILEVINGRVEKLPNAFQELKSKGVFKILEHGSEESDKILVLRILTKIVDSTSSELMLEVLQFLTELHKYRNPVSRDTLYTLFVTLHQKYTRSVASKDEDTVDYKILTASKDVLLQGLTDSENRLRIRCCNFWSEETQLPSETAPRMESLLLKMYSPLTESQFLQYCSYLFLEMTAKSPDYNRKIYETPLSDCKFENYQISLSWRQRHSVMTPLFTDSFVNRSSLGSLGDFAVKATQNDQQFTATQDLRGKVTDWVTQSSLDTFSNDASLSSASVSSLLFTGPSTQRKDIATKSAAVKSGPINTEGDGKYSEFKRLRRRFLKNQESTRKYFMKTEIRKKEMREVTRKEQVARREAQVTMYRQYRTGELPDIEITYKALIAPLQALAQQDSNIAKTLVCKIVLAIATELKDNSLEEEFDSFSKSVSDAMNQILSKSSQYFPPVVAFAQEVLYHHVNHVDLVPENVTTASIASNQHNTGILLLEAYIDKCKNIETDQNPEPTQKKIKLDENINNDGVTTWIKLAEVYKSLDNYDMVRSIFSLGVKIQPGTQKAMEYEAVGDYTTAIIFYNELYEEVNRIDDSSNVQQAEINYWDDSMLKCYSEMTSWDKLENVITNRLPNSDDLNSVWDDPFSQEHLLPYIIKSKLKTILEDRETNNSLLNFIDKSLKDRDKKIVIEGKFSEELALLHLIQENYNQSIYLTDLSLRNFLEEWTGLSILIPGAREKLFSSLQQLSEMDQFLNLVTKSNLESDSKKLSLIKKWEHRLPAFNDPTSVWNDVILNRQFYLKRFNKQNTNNSQVEASDSLQMTEDIMDTTENVQEVKAMFLKSIVNMKLALIDNACLQKNITVASKTISWITEKIRPEEKLKEELWVKSIHAYCKIHNLKVSKLASTSIKRFETLLNVWFHLNDLDEEFLKKTTRDDKLNHYLYLAENLNQISLELKSNPESFTAIKPSKIRDKFVKEFGKNQIPQMVEKLEKNCFDNLKRALTFSKPKKVSKDTSCTMKLVTFCNNLLREVQVSNSHAADVKIYASTFIESLFTTLQTAEHQAILLLPRALHLVREYPYLAPLFTKNSSKIPCWMFISCLDELLVLLDQPSSSWIHPVVTSICDTYPNALVYPFNVASENYHFDDTDEGRDNQAFVKMIRSKLDKLVLVKEFLIALNYLRNPTLILKDGLNELVHLKKQNADRGKISEVVEKLWNDVFNVETSGRKFKVGGYGGIFHSKFAQEFKDIAVQALGDKLVKLIKMEDFRIAQNVFQKMSRMDSKLKLEDLSSFLHKFQSFQYKDELEIPGQYNGMSKPIPEHHVKISGFDQTVSVLPSIETPRKLVIRGNDEKEYPFLVKFGEDLRQDERIEKTFRIMNNIYANDPKSGPENLKINTYNVIPLSSRYGLIQWVENTVTLKDLIKKYLTDEQNASLDVKHSMAKFFKWASKGMKSVGNQDASVYYTNAYTNRTDSQVTTFYNIMKTTIPADLFRTIFLSLSSSLESFLTLRTQFIKSHSVMCVSQWILGIGDRHLSNTLLQRDSGEQVGIDFGHAFGSATQKLRIPELIPFRLTPQFINLMSPMGEKGMIENTMIHALEALRNNRDILMDVLDIFIKAPTTEWIRSEQNLFNVSETGEKNSYAKEKVEIARKKLNGANPAIITIEDLELGHSGKSVLPSFVKFARGNSETDIRAQLPNYDLSVKNQWRNV